MIIEALRHYVNLRHSDWAEQLIHVEAAMNNSVNATTGKTPTELVYGTPLRLFPSPNDLAKPDLDIPAYQIIFSGSKTISPSPETITLRPRRNKPLMQTRNDRRSQITGLETRFIWKPRIYGYGSRRRAEVQSFTHAMSVRLRSLRWNQLPRITDSSYHQSF